MKKSSQKKQPYVFFCLEKAQTERHLAGKSLAELIDLCSDMWKSLPLERRQGYVDMAKDHSEGRPYYLNPGPNAAQGDVTGRFDSLGRSLVALQNNELQSKFEHDLMRQDVEWRVRRRRHDCDEVVSMRFHIMHVNTWTVSSETSDVFPAEIAMVEMSLGKGVTGQWLQMVDPGEMPPGYKGDMKIHSEKYHKIWLDNTELTDNYCDIVKHIEKHLRCRKGEEYVGQEVSIPGYEDIALPFHYVAAQERGLLPIYVMPEHKEVIGDSLKWLCNQAKLPYVFVLYELPYLFRQLLEAAPQELPTKMTLTIAEAHLQRDVFFYTRGVSCPYHEEVESCLCAGGAAVRLAYIICDFCCQVYDIKPKEGRHLPLGLGVEKKLEENSSFKFSSMSSSNQSFANYSFIDDDMPLRDSRPAALGVDSRHVLHQFKTDEGALKDLDTLLLSNHGLPESINDALSLYETMNSTMRSFEASFDLDYHLESRPPYVHTSSFFSATDTFHYDD